jgi:PKD repeat protein
VFLLIPFNNNFNRVNNAIAEINQFNVKNIENPNLPIQIEVPVRLEQGVCSAFRIVTDKYFGPTPNNYDDFSADTKISLKITNENTGQLYYQDSVTIPIYADTCTTVAPFTWTPPANLEDERIKFRVETDVVDGQAQSSIKDWAEVIETIYPENLDGACWARIQDFTLSNQETFDLTTSLTEIYEGETLYAGFKSGAFRDEVMTPMNYKIEVFFDSNLVTSEIFSTSGSNLNTKFVNLNSYSEDNGVGDYEVKVVATPQGSSCDILESAEAILNLKIRDLPEYDVSFTIRNTDLDLIEGANINLRLLEADGDFINEPNYNKNKLSNSNGFVLFDDVIAGDYRYSVSKSGFETKTNDIYINTDTDIQVILEEGNAPPIIYLPESFSTFYQDDLIINLENYVTDPNEAFSDLTTSYELLTGSVGVSNNNGVYTIVCPFPQIAKLKFIVEDSEGLIAQDTTDIICFDNNVPDIVEFRGVPDSGFKDLVVDFIVNVQDDDEILECRIEYGDGNSDSVSNSDDCLELDLRHIYTDAGVYTARLIVEDSLNDPVVKTEIITVLENDDGRPQIQFFRLNSSNGVYVPTNLSLSWKAIHTSNQDIFCTITVYGITNDVPCEFTLDIDNFYAIGDVDFILVASDGTYTDSRTITVNFREENGTDNNAPEILEFDGTPLRGFEDLEVTFDVMASDSDNDLLKCRLIYGDGSFDEVLNSADCSELDGKTHIYRNPGNYTAVLRVDDSIDTISRNLNIEVLDVMNNAPEILEFDGTPLRGFEDLEVTFDVRASDSDNDLLTCKLTYGDGSFNEVFNSTDCSELDGIKYTYTNPGNYTAVLFVSDSSEIVSRNLNIEVLDVMNNAPEILEFDGTPLRGFEDLEVTFDVRASDSDNDLLTCKLTYGDGSFNEVFNSADCSELDGKTHIYRNPGNYTAVLRVDDSIDTISRNLNIEVLDVMNNAPEILEFEGTPLRGFEDLEVTFDVRASDSDNDLLTCKLTYGDGSFNEVFNSADCSELDGKTHIYRNPGNYTAVLRVDDSIDTISRNLNIEVLDVMNNAPEILEFEGTPLRGFEDLEVTFDVRASDSDNDLLTCKLTYGDGSFNEVFNSTDCSELDGIKYIYTNPGNYTAVLFVSDSSEIVSRNLNIEVLELDAAPIVESFTLRSSKGIIVPSDLTFEWRITHPLNDSMVCELLVDDLLSPTANGLYEVNCLGSKILDNFNISGDLAFTVRARDSNGDTDSKTIYKTFYTIEDRLDENDVSLIINNTLELGDFDFYLKINESIINRIVNIKPIIICNGISNYLDTPGGFSNQYVVSRYGGSYRFLFDHNTRDYTLKVPLNTDCIFRVEIYDNLGSFIALEENIRFEEAQDEFTYPSIRGKGSDMINYLTLILLEPLKGGYNIFQTNVINNEDESKNIRLTITSRQLGINENVNINLRADSVKRVDIPLYIKEGTKPGKYPVRISFNDGSDKQTRYSYILVE